MGRVMQLAAAVVIATTAIARAGGGTQHVMVETEPKGAVVYLDDVESGPKCEATPCGFDVPVGSYTLIVRKDAYVPWILSIDIPRRPKKPLVFKNKLEAATAKIVIDNAAAKGASVTVDAAAKGKVDASGNLQIDVEPGGHQIAVTLNGKSLFEDFVDIDVGQEYIVKIPGAATTTAAKGGDKDKDKDKDKDTKPPPKETASTEEGGETTDTTESTSGGEVTSKAAAPPERGHYVSAEVVVDVGFRRFSYQNPQMGPLSPETEDGQVIGGPAVEVWPMEIFDMPHLRGLSVFAKFEFPLNHQDVQDSTKNTIAQTQWQTIEASVRYHWNFGQVGVEVGAGYVNDKLGFSGDPGDVQKLPDADYSSLRIGLRGSLNFGPVEPYVSAENRVLLDGGELPKRFCANASCASGNGIRAAIGVAAKSGSFVARVEASDVHYSWTFQNSGQTGGNFFMADGSTDKILGLQFLLGYQY